VESCEKEGDDHQEVDQTVPPVQPLLSGEVGRQKCCATYTLEIRVLSLYWDFGVHAPEFSSHVWKRICKRVTRLPDERMQSTLHQEEEHVAQQEHPDS